MNDQARLLQGSLHSLSHLLYSQRYSLSAREYDYLNMSVRERAAVFRVFPQFAPLAAQFHAAGALLRPFELDATELALLATLLVLDPGTELDCASSLLPLAIHSSTTVRVLHSFHYVNYYAHNRKRSQITNALRS